MARDHARIWLSIWSDDDFRALPPDAQHLYFVLVTSPSLSYAGVADWRPGRIAANAAGWTAGAVRSAAEPLVRGLYVVIDEDSEEVLLRSFIRNDGLMKNPNVAVSMALAFADTASPTLRGVIVHELKRLHDTEPDLKGWPKVASLLDRKAIDPASYPFGYPSPQEVGQQVAEPLAKGVGYPFPQGVPKGVGYPLDQGVDQPFDYPQTEGFDQGIPQGVGSLPAPAPAPSSSSIGGHLTGERHYVNAADSIDPPPKFHPQHPAAYEPDCVECERTARRYERHLALALSDTEPSPYCDRHPGGTLDACRECHRKREAATQWHEDRRHAEALRQSEAARTAADTRAQAIAACPLGCADRDGYRPDGRVCSHDPDEADRARRGMDAVRAALAERRATS